MIDIETGRTFTFEAFNKECNRYANFFQVTGPIESMSFL
ncbi:hypothetical protein COOONC_14663 [Cooperia oncophora]